MELAAVGRSQFLLGFALAGVKMVLANSENLFEKVQECKDAGIVIVDGTLTKDLPYIKKEELMTSIEPVVIVLSEEGDEEMQQLRQSIKSTLGVDLLK